jgi:uncharacterized membrane protein YhaH (DUF805 family)
MLTASGRANRGRYWLTILVLFLPFFVVLSVAPFVVAGFQVTSLSGVSVILGIIYLAIVVPALLVTIRRLHDRDKSGHWLWLFYLVPAVLNGAASAPQLQANPAVFGLSLIGFGISVWAFVEIGCLRGTVGANRFGPDPLQEGLPTLGDTLSDS